MEFIIKHKYVAIGAAGVAAAAIIGGAIALSRIDSDTVADDATIARYTTNADTGYGDAADIDGKTVLRGYRSGSRVPIGPLESRWTASRSANILIVDPPKAMDGGSVGIREEAETIIIPLPGWEDSNINDMVVSRQKLTMVMSPSEPDVSAVVILSTKFGKGDTVNAIMTRKDGKPFPKGFVLPQINAQLGERGTEDELL